MCRGACDGGPAVRRTHQAGMADERAIIESPQWCVSHPQGRQNDDSARLGPLSVEQLSVSVLSQVHGMGSCSWHIKDGRGDGGESESEIAGMASPCIVFKYGRRFGPPRRSCSVVRSIMTDSRSVDPGSNPGTSTTCFIGSDGAS